METASLGSLPSGKVYDMYRDLASWYRMIDPALADPANEFLGPDKVTTEIKNATAQAERFHATLLGDYYHPPQLRLLRRRPWPSFVRHLPLARTQNSVCARKQRACFRDAN